MSEEKKDNQGKPQPPEKVAAPPKVSVKKPEASASPENTKAVPGVIPGILKPGEAPAKAGAGGGDPAHTAMIVVPPGDREEKGSDAAGSAEEPRKTSGTEAVAGKSEPETDGKARDFGDSSQTIHIQLPEEELPRDSSGSEKRPATPTVRLKRPPAAKPYPPGKAGEEAAKPARESGSSTSKSTTSRIPLSEAIPAIATGKTVRAGRPQGGSGVPKPGSHPLPSLEKPPSEAQTQAAKSKTSRISLNDALGVATEEPESSGIPKTIRLKRPPASESPTIQAAKPPVSSGGSAAKEAKQQTAKLPDNVGQDSENVTQRKTIKLRRPEESPVAGLADEEETTDLDNVTSGAATGPDRVHWVFVFSSLAAVLVGVLLIWVLAAQAVGPDKSLTRFSSWPNGPRLWMPGTSLPEQ